jgi:hypothetical protein
MTTEYRHKSLFDCIALSHVSNPESVFQPIAYSFDVTLCIQDAVTLTPEFLPSYAYCNSIGFIHGLV